MSVQESLKSLRESIQDVRPVLGQLRVIDAIIAAHAEESAQAVAVNKEKAIVESDYAQFKQTTAKKIVDLVSNNVTLIELHTNEITHINAAHATEVAHLNGLIKELDSENAKLKQPPTEEILLHRSGVKFKRSRETAGRFLPVCPKCGGTVDELLNQAGATLIFCTSHCGWERRLSKHDILSRMLAELMTPII